MKELKHNPETLDLKLSLTRQWFDRTADDKTEDYRKITPYWVKRLMYTHEEMENTVFEELCEDLKEPTKRHESLSELMDYFAVSFKPFTTNTTTLGYPKSTDTDRIQVFEHAGIEIRTGR